MQEGGKALELDMEQKQGQMKVELTTGQYFQSQTTGSVLRQEGYPL